MDYTLKRSRRRTLSILVLPDGTLIAHAPRLMPRYFIDRFVLKHQDWVGHQRHKVAEAAVLYPVRQFVSGETFQRWGEVVTLQVIQHATQVRPVSRFELNTLIVEIPSVPQEKRKTTIAAAIRDAFQKETEARLPELIEKYAGLLGAQPLVIKVVEQKRRWGSCSRRGSLRFNWRLSMFAPEILEYVVVHELSHLKVPNHSKKFWTIVRSVLPEYKLRRRALRLSAVHVRM